MIPKNYLRKLELTDNRTGYVIASYDSEKPYHSFINLVISSDSSFSGIADKFSNDIKLVVDANGKIKRPYFNDKEKIFMPLYGYKHSCMGVNRKPYGCTFDSGILGYIEIDKQTIRETFNCSRITNKIKDKINTEIDTFLEYMDSYLNGDVYDIFIIHNDIEEIEIYTIYGYKNIDKVFEISL